ncbi:lysozyme inhibitor LprI family protein [Guptibacillus sedimenti]|uniref:lysozyme inhibitor LprI family protein n=1 Tax=Guptibacillus sedimenti TaxID=3025680 RepID=UPI002360534C|nr:lysozyme inhibitor LprI family protein [Pseudalkalibacillus sedimenti]
MKLQTKLSMILLTFALSACGNSTNESSAQSNNQLSSNTSPQLTEEDDSAEEVGEDTSADDLDVNKQEDASARTTEDSTNGEKENSDQLNVENQENQKEKYFKKLNSMYESDRNVEVKETIVEMEEQEAERYQNWDKMLNEIYGVLQAQLPSDEMDQLREEQRNWVDHRDEAAKKASLKYEGGSTESLEYVATQASLTRERCYALVAKYMN